VSVGEGPGSPRPIRYPQQLDTRRPRTDLAGHAVTMDEPADLHETLRLLEIVAQLDDEHRRQVLWLAEQLLSWEAD
jgi:hypothetical protein